jgi:transposase-like protein
MIHIEEYIQNNNISRRWAYELIQDGKLVSIKKNGRTYIVDPVKLNTLKERELKALVKEVKIEFDSMLEGVAKGKNDQVIVFEEIQKRMEMLGRHGVEIKGYSLKSFTARQMMLQR